MRHRNVGEQWCAMDSHSEQWPIAKVVSRESSVTIRDVSANPTRKQSVRRSVAIGLLVHENSRWNIDLRWRSCQRRQIDTATRYQCYAKSTSADPSSDPRICLSTARPSSSVRELVLSLSAWPSKITSPNPLQIAACFSWRDLTSVSRLSWNNLSRAARLDSLSRHRDVVLSFYRGRIYSTEAVRLSEIPCPALGLFSSERLRKASTLYNGRRDIPSNILIASLFRTKSACYRMTWSLRESCVRGWVPWMSSCSYTYPNALEAS